MFDKQKYLNKCLEKLTKDIDSLEELKLKNPKLEQIINKCFEYFDEGNLILYRALFHVCGSSCSFEFFGNLYSFLANAILDDSYFKIILEDGDQTIVWAYDDDEEGIQDPDKILEVFNWYDEEDLKRKSQTEEIHRMLAKLGIR